MSVHTNSGLRDAWIDEEKIRKSIYGTSHVRLSYITVRIELVDDEQPSLEILDLVTNAVEPESYHMRPSVPYDPNFRFIPIPLPPDRPKSKENRHTVIHMPDESSDEPDSYVRYDSSSGRADTSGIEAYWNRPPPENFIPPPPYWPPVSYVPPPPPEHVEAYRYEPTVKTPSAQTGDEDLITEQPDYGTTTTYDTAYDHLRQQAPAFGFRKTQNACPPQGPNGPLPKVSPQPRNEYSDNLERDKLFLRRYEEIIIEKAFLRQRNMQSQTENQEIRRVNSIMSHVLEQYQTQEHKKHAEQVIFPKKMEPSHMPWQRNEPTPPPRRSSAARTDIDHAVYGTPNLNRNQGNQANNQQARGPPQNETESTTSAERMHPSRPVPSQRNEPAVMSVSSFCGTSRSHVTVESEIGHANPNTYAVPNGKRNDGFRIIHNQTLTKTDQDRPAYETPLSGQMRQGPMSSPRNGLSSAAMPPPPPCGAYGAQSAPKLVPVSSDGPRRSSPSPPSWYGPQGATPPSVKLPESKEQHRNGNSKFKPQMEPNRSFLTHAGANVSSANGNNQPEMKTTRKLNEWKSKSYLDLESGQTSEEWTEISLN
ncbi:hypothetical protein OUZ56_030092 [Daphnia magna]|uniref:Uncharacterized protein n=1 Tax=Daphnia magna TaxID=35525 RepID=A0ABQ9ZQB7_9CRUS|nr:hypothetical protein OUZ56_030092 [Daphnia magna]